jgi:hypothetical protein
MDRNRRGSRCKGKTKAGNPCRAAATAGGLCFFHANPNRAAELGRKGGRSKRHVTEDGSDPLPALESVQAVRAFVARLLHEVYFGETHPSVVRGLAPLLYLQLRVMHDAEIEERLSKLEQELSQLDDRSRDLEEADSASGGTDGGSLR